ncbi:MAG: hypothetical protein L0177_18270 [Chloroflexi bacterium]|nr:hypothetical protein [Chloroflexota bacterium]
MSANARLRQAVIRPITSQDYLPDGTVNVTIGAVVPVSVRGRKSRLKLWQL